MRPFAGVVLQAGVSLPPLIYFYIKAQDKELVGMMLAVFGGFFVDRCIEAWDRAQLAREAKETNKKVENAIDRLAMLSADVNKMGHSMERAIGQLRTDFGVADLRRIPLAEAFAYAQAKLKTANRMLNTSFSIRGHGRGVSTGYEQWIAAIVDAVSTKGCVVHEVVASSERARAVNSLLARQPTQLAGRYLVTDLSQSFTSGQVPPFIEFVVFENSDGKEVVFGWSTSSDFAANQECFATANAPVVAFFEAQFSRLALLGQSTEGRSAVG